MAPLLHLSEIPVRHRSTIATMRAPQAESWATMLVALSGIILLNGDLHGNGTVLLKTQVATLSGDGNGVHIKVNPDAKLWLLAGDAINEPVVGHGPFVMNSQQEIVQAITDFNNGESGAIV